MYAIVVHSGYSSDGGHYYTYAREPKSELEQENCEPEEDIWFEFNDSKVSFSNFDSFRSMFRRFPRDTAYQLFYRKVSSNENQSESIAEVNQSRLWKKRPLRADLKMAVEKDNLKFLREKERLNSKSDVSTNANWNQRKDNDGDDDRGMGGCGGGGFNAPGRLVC